MPVLNSVTPSGFSEGTTTVAVNGSQFVYGSQILWNGVAVPTTFVSGTQLVASIAAPNPGTFPLVVRAILTPVQQIQRQSPSWWVQDRSS